MNFSTSGLRSNYSTIKSEQCEKKVLFSKKHHIFAVNTNLNF